MDWLFKFCVIIWVLCVSKSQTQLLNPTKQECDNYVNIPPPDECNRCTCHQGKVLCSTLICIPAPQCVDKELYPAQNGCNTCICRNGFIMCSSNNCDEGHLTANKIRRSPFEVLPLDECKDGDDIPPPPPPNDCNTCYCLGNRIMCTLKGCTSSIRELKEQNEQNNLEVFDKQIAVEPFIDILYKKYDITPTKLIHTHAYNGFHQEIKVHFNQLPKHTAKLLNVLAASLDNPALVGISDRLSSSSVSLHNNPESKKQFVDQGNETNSSPVPLCEGNVLTKQSLNSSEIHLTQSSKLITSGSQSNETILVIPDLVSDNQNSQSVLPITNKYETLWDTVSSPAPVVEEEKLITSIDQHEMISDPPFSQENELLTPIPPRIVSKYNELQYVPLNHLTRPGEEKTIITSYNNEGQNNLLQSQFESNSSIYHSNQVKSQQFQTELNQNNYLATLNNKGSQYSPEFPNNPNQTILSVKPLQSGLKPGQESIGFINYKGNETDSQFKSFSQSNNFQIKPPHINQCDQDKPISIIENEGSKQVSPPSIFVLNSTASDTNNQSKLISSLLNKDKYNTTHTQYDTHSTMTYVSEYDPIDQVGYNTNQHYNVPHENTYEYNENVQADQRFHETDSTLSKKVKYFLNLPRIQLNQDDSHLKNYNSVHRYTAQTVFSPGQRQNDTLKLHPNKMFEVNKYNQHNQYKSTFDKYFHSPSDNQFNTYQIKPNQYQTYPTISGYPNSFTDYPHSSTQSQFKLLQNKSKTWVMNDQGSANSFPHTSNVDPAHLKVPCESSYSQFDHTQYKPSSIYDLLNGNHQSLNQNKNALSSKLKITTNNKQSTIQQQKFKPIRDQYNPSVIDNDNPFSFISNQNENIDISNIDKLYTEQDISFPSTDLMDTQYIPVNESPPIDDSEFSVSSSDHLGHKILDWLKGNLKKPVPTKHNETVTKNGITKIFKLLSKLTPLKIKNTALHNIPSAFNQETIKNNMDDFQENQTLNTTQYPLIDSTMTYENRFNTVPKAPEESRTQALQVNYAHQHIIHQSIDDAESPQYIETGAGSLASDMESEELSASFFPKLINPRFRHRPKVQKEECGEGTEWISNCHGCSCYFGQAMCFIIPGCDLRPFGEPMTCKPYSQFKMGDCYSCECNGDGVAECDATDCNTELDDKDKVSSSTTVSLPIYNEFFDDKKAEDLIQYYSFFQKLPKDCPSEPQYPTCQPGTSWVSSCHKCECNENSKHECTQIEDCELDYNSYGQPSRCKPNTKFYPKTTSMPCVECSCDDEGNPYCPSVDNKKK